MNKEEPHRDQAERLRKKIEKVHDEDQKQLDSGVLPPRSEIHQQKKKKTNLKLKYPVIRLLVLFFILLPVVSFSIYTINENEKRGSSEKVSNDRQDYEVVDVETNEKPVNMEPIVKDKETEEPIEPEEPVSTVPAKAIETPPIVNAAPDPKDKTPVKKEKTPKEKAASAGKIKYHKVQPEDTLFNLAMKYYRSQSGIEKIKNANGIQGDEIQVGQTLKIPMK